MILNLIHLRGLPVEEQLDIELFLMKNRQDNWAIINEGTTPSVVMGVLGKEEEVLDKNVTIKVIRRFSGGGTVVVDENTIFVSFIFQSKEHSFGPFPENIMNWSEDIYKRIFKEYDFSVKENDYVLGDKKCGGNAQYIKKDRWLHHTSFLWDFSETRMKNLLFPQKVPNYRRGRPHQDFLCKIKDFLPSKDSFIKRIKDELRRRYEIRKQIYLPNASSDFPEQSRKMSDLWDVLGVAKT